MSKSPWLSICLAFTFACAHAAPPPAAEWVISPAGDATLSITDSTDILLLDFTIPATTPGLTGHRKLFSGYVDLLLKQPVELTADNERVYYEFLDLTKGSIKLQLRPLIRDAEGELFEFRPHPYPHLNSGMQNWSQWITASYQSGEAGAPTHDIYDLVSNAKNFTPDPQLTLLGFRLTAYRYADKLPEGEHALRGQAALGEFGLTGRLIPYQHPFMYVDSLLTKKDRYTIGVQIRNQFQATPISEFRQEIDFDPASPASRHQTITFPLGPNDNYWLCYQIIDSSGQMIEIIQRDQHSIAGKVDYQRYQMQNNPDTAPVSQIDNKKAPPVGYLRINPDHAGLGVYERPDMQLELRVFPGDKENLTVNWQLCAYDYPDIIDQGETTVTATDNDFVTININPKTETNRDAYELKVEVRDQKLLVDSQSYFVGYKTDRNQRHDRTGSLTDRQEVKKQPYNRTTYIKDRTVTSEDAAVEHFRAWLIQASGVTENLTYMIDLKDLETLPGVFNFALLDRIMDTAADCSGKVTVRLAHSDQNGINLYRWPKYSRQFNYDGTIVPGHRFYGAYSVLDPDTQSLWLNAYRALYDRYCQHTAFQGYYIMQPGGEWTVVDQPWNSTLSGYDQATVQGFRDWLKSQFTLGQLNTRWDTNLSDYADIEAPMPDFSGGVNPDLRLQWLDFNRFKNAIDREVWMPTAINSIREYDNKRITIAYARPDISAQTMGDKLDYGHNGGNHYGENLGRYIDAWEKYKVGWITEPHHPHQWAAYGDPAEKGWVLDWSVWVMLAQAGGGGSNLHIYYVLYPALEREAHYGGYMAYDAFESYKPILTEMHGITLFSPQCQVAVLQDPFTLYTKHRTTFRARLADLKRWFELAQQDSVWYEELVPEKLSEYKLLLPNILDEVISQETLELLDKQVRAGSKMIITANTGKYVPELSKEPYQLLQRLGIKPPVKGWERKGEEVCAVAGENALLFDQGQRILFQTGDSLHNQLQSDAVRADFLQYRYRWIPETDYFGHYPDHEVSDGTVLAKFVNGGAALSLHKVDAGEVLVFWGTPDIGGDNLKGMMSRAADWAKVVDPTRTNPLPYVREATHKALQRHYLLVYNEKPGVYTLAVPNIPDGWWFLDDPVSRQRFGSYDGKYMRENGLTLTWSAGYSPLKIVRMLPIKLAGRWHDKYPVVPDK